MNTITIDNINSGIVKQIFPPIGGAIAKDTLSGMAFNAITMGANSFQFFIYPPNYGNANVRKFSPEDINLARVLLSKGNVIPVIHSNYIHNFFKPNGIILSKIIYECEIAAQIGAAGVVVHMSPGYNLWDFRQPLANFATIVAEMKKRGIKTRILFENIARAKAGKCYSSIAQFAQFQHAVYNAGLSDYYGMCIDLCHANILRKRRMNTFAEIKNYFDKLDAAIGIKNVKVIHFNDVIEWTMDKHGIPLLGALSNPLLGGDAYTILYVLRLATIFNIPLIIERHRLSNVKYGVIIVALKSLAAQIGDRNALKLILDDFYLFKSGLLN